ncbi:DUF768 domain-containing protein [Mesorhizobium sp. 128a]
MSTRCVNFLDKWIPNNIPEMATADRVSVDELTHKVIADASRVGIKRSENDEAVSSLDRVLVDAIVPGMSKRAVRFFHLWREPKSTSSRGPRLNALVMQRLAGDTGGFART